ncbi:hypothetical protein CHCC14600_3791 [Bacillus licheniformis]|nr:hypothetical protein CHCC14600_3791 [Bacillus licheniformis]
MAAPAIFSVAVCVPLKSKRIQYRGISVRILCETFCPQSRL